MNAGRVVQINVSAGGVPKLPTAAARVTIAGLAGDRHRLELERAGACETADISVVADRDEGQQIHLHGQIAIERVGRTAEGWSRCGRF